MRNWVTLSSFFITVPLPYSQFSFSFYILLVLRLIFLFFLPDAQLFAPTRAQHMCCYAPNNKIATTGEDKEKQKEAGQIGIKTYLAFSKERCQKNGITTINPS